MNKSLLKKSLYSAVRSIRLRTKNLLIEHKLVLMSAS
jgi:hypothetical protein